MLPVFASIIPVTPTLVDIMPTAYIEYVNAEAMGNGKLKLLTELPEVEIKP